MAIGGLLHLTPSEGSSVESTSPPSLQAEAPLDPSPQPLALNLYWDAESGANVVHYSGLHQMDAATVQAFIVLAKQAAGYHTPGPGGQQWCFDSSPSSGRLTCSGPSKTAIAQCWWYHTNPGVTTHLACGYRT